MVKESNRLSPAAAMSLNKGCEERPSKRKEGWEAGTEGAGAGAGPPGGGGQHTRVLTEHGYILYIHYTNTHRIHIVSWTDIAAFQANCQQLMLLLSTLTQSPNKHLYSTLCNPMGLAKQLQSQ